MKPCGGQSGKIRSFESASTAETRRCPAKCQQLKGDHRQRQSGRLGARIVWLIDQDQNARTYGPALERWRQY